MNIWNVTIQCEIILHAKKKHKALYTHRIHIHISMKKSDFVRGIKDKNPVESEAETDNGGEKRRQLPEISQKAWDGVNELRKKRGITWNEFFNRINNYQDWTEHLLRLPQNPSLGDKLNAVTVAMYMPLWLSNIYNSFLKEPFKEIHDVKEIFGTAKAKPGIIVSAGPSLYKYKHLELLAQSDFYKNKVGPILTTSHTVKDCLECGIIPDYMILLDPEPVMILHIDHKIIDKYADKITGVFSATTYPDVLKRWKGKKLFFLPSISDRTTPNVQAMFSGIFPMLQEMNALANAGSFSWSIAKFLGCNPIVLIGMDQGFLMDTPVENTPYYPAYKQPSNTREDVIKDCFYHHTHSFFKTDRYTDDIYGNFAKNIIASAKLAKEEEGISTINCTGGGFVDDPSIIENEWFEKWLKKWKKD